MPASPAAMRCSPGREPRGGDNHKRGRSLENGIVFKERDDDLALFNEVQTRERDDFLLQSNDDFEDTFVTKLRHFSDHKLGINVASRGESSDLLNTEEEKNDYEWLITPPDTPLFPSLDDEAPQVILARGRTRTQPISMSRSSTMEKRSSRGNPSPNRLSPSPRSRNTTFQPRGRASSGPSASPPPTLRPTTPPSTKRSSPAPRAATPTSRRLSTGSTSITSPGPRGTSPIKPSRGNSASPKIRAWQANIPGFSTEAPPNLRTSLADRPASYIRGSSPASRNGRHSKSPTASRSISSSHSHDRDRLSSRSKGSVTSSADDEVESLASITVDGPERLNSRKVSGIRNNKALFSQKPSRPVSSSSAPKRSFDLALRQMDHRKGPQNMFRPLLSSVPSSTLYAGKASPAWNSSVTTSSNASSDFDTSGAHDIEEESELNQDDASSEYVKVPLPDCNVDDEVFIFEKNEDMRHEKSHDISSSAELDFKGDLTLHSRLDGFENLVERDTATSVVSDDFPEVDSLMGALICSRCGCRYSDITPTEEEIKLCANCRNSYSSMNISDSSMNIRDSAMISDSSMNISDSSMNIRDSSMISESSMNIRDSSMISDSSMNVRDSSMNVRDSSMNISDSSMNISDTVTSEVAKGSSQGEPTISDEDYDLLKTVKSEMTLVESPEVSYEIEPHKDLVKDEKVVSESSLQEPTQVNHQVISQPSIDFSRPKVDFLGEGISTMMKRSSSVKGPVFRSGNFSASSISYDDLSYVRGSTNSMKSSMGRGSLSASSSVDFGSAIHSDTRFHRQLSSKKSDIENYKYQRSLSSLSGTSSHAFRPPSVGTSTLDSFDTSIVRGGKDAATATTAASVGSQENSGENEDVSNVIVEIDSAPEVPTIVQTALDSAESLNLEEADSFQKVEEVGKDNDGLTVCNFEEDASLDGCVESTDVVEVQLGAISEGEISHSCSSSSRNSQGNVSQRSERSIEEFQESSIPTTTLAKDLAGLATDGNTSNHSSSIIEESMVLVEGQGGIKGRSLTLEEATDTILFCSSIVHNLAYEAASIAIDKETPPDNNNGSWPLVPAVGKGYSARKEVQIRKTSSKRASKKARQKKATKSAAATPNNTNNGEETDLPKTRIVFPNNKENTKPPKLESKCNCRIM